MQDHEHRQVVRVGDTVRRPAQPWTPEVHTLLRQLEAVGFPYAPRALGFDDQGREVLSYIDGESGPQGWAKVVGDEGLDAFARLLREYHDATAAFSPPGQVVCHGDFVTWNVVWQGTRPVGIIDGAVISRRWSSRSCWSTTSGRSSGRFADTRTKPQTALTRIHDDRTKGASGQAHRGRKRLRTSGGKSGVSWFSISRRQRGNAIVFVD